MPMPPNHGGSMRGYPQGYNTTGSVRSSIGPGGFPGYEDPENWMAQVSAAGSMRGRPPGYEPTVRSQSFRGKKPKARMPLPK